MRDRSRRVGALTWNRDLVTSGNCEGLILERDTRTPSLVADRRLVGHQQKVSRK
jgi:cell division cycle 20-like protein 1 (cofactor of APC complex)